MLNLPIVDLTDYHTHTETFKPFVALTPESEQEDGQLKSLLHVDELLQRFTVHVAAQPTLEEGEIKIYGQLHPMAQTESGEIVAVAIQFAICPSGSHGRWVAFVVEPDNYAELQEEIEAKINEYRKYLENMIRGAEGKN